jgi:hypothetical protein
MTANRSSAASLTEELRKTLESSYLDGGFSGGPPGSAGSQHKASSREKVIYNIKIVRITKFNIVIALLIILTYKYLY